MPENSANQWLTVRQVAAELGVHPETVYDAIRRGNLPAVRLSRRTIRVSRAALEAAGLQGAAT